MCAEEVRGGLQEMRERVYRRSERVCAKVREGLQKKERVSGEASNDPMTQDLVFVHVSLQAGCDSCHFAP